MHPHLHLLLNHFPIIGTVLCTGILIAGYVLKNNTVKNVALGLFVAVALISVPAFFSGGAAEHATKDLSWFEHDRIEEHEEAALWALILIDILGVLAAATLYLAVKNKPYHAQLTIAVLIFSLVVAAAMFRAGDTGGEIRHLELRHEGEAAE